MYFISFQLYLPFTTPKYSNIVPENIGRYTMANPNHPKLGSTIKVEPIKSKRAILAIKGLLASKPRDLALFTLGINTNLRASDLVALQVQHVKGLRPGDDLVLREQKTQKPRRITLNKVTVDALHNYLATRPDAEPTAPLFPGREGAMRANTITALVKQWCREIGLKGNYGSHSLRKTWGFHQRKTFGVDIPTLMVCFNHSTQRQTLDYLCIQPEEVQAVYANEL